jgi:hypothetical protein
VQVVCEYAAAEASLQERLQLRLFVQQLLCLVGSKACHVLP